VLDELSRWDHYLRRGLDFAEAEVHSLDVGFDDGGVR
jgi:hypothetical protein